MTQLETPTQTPKLSRNLQKVRKDIELLRKARAEAEARVLSAEFVEDSDEGLPEIETDAVLEAGKSTENENEPTQPEEVEEPIVEAEIIDEITDDFGDGFDVAAYQASITKGPEHTEEGFGEYGFDGLWLWPSEIAKYKSTTLAEFLKAREVPKQPQISHTSYVGGRWFIPKVETLLFLSLYYRDCIRNGIPQFISERQLRWRKFRFNVDWDMEPPEYSAFLARNNLDELSFDRNFTAVVLRSIGHLLPGHARLIYTKNPDIPNKVHIYFPTVLVKTADMGLEWLALIQQEFLLTFTADGENWDKIFDRGVLTNGSASLRMIGSQNKKRNGSYKPLDLITGQYTEITAKDLYDTVLQTEIHMDDSPYKESEDPESPVVAVTSADIASLKRYTEATAEAKPFPSQSLKFKDAKPGFFSDSFVVDLEDRFCPFVSRPHQRSTSYMYLLITRHGTWLKCWNSECRGKNIRLKEEHQSYIADLFPKAPGTIEDVCGGGESADDETAVEQPKKRKKSKPKVKKRAAKKEDIGDWMKSPALDKSVIRALYDDDADRHDQPALTGYLNRFIAYIHQNDTYGFRLRDDQPFDIFRKAAVVNKMERFEIQVPPFSVWCKNENRREFTDVVFDTSDKKHPTTTLNLFGGYKAKMLDRKVEAEEVEIFLYHLRDVICRGHKENYRYYLFWWAWFFQKGRTGIMVILLSELKGMGKNIIPELLAEYVIGDKYVAVTDKIDTVVQRFNAIMVEKALIVANELKDVSRSAKESSRVEEVLKTMIKDRTTAIEKKGLDTIVVPSTVNFHGTSNNLVPLKVDRDQRRYVFLDVSPHKKGDFAYFETLGEFVKSHANEIFTFLNQIDLTGWGPEKNLVQTEYTKRVQRAFINPIHQFWYDSGYCDVDFAKTPHLKDPIYDQYTAWHKKEKGEHAKVCAGNWFGRQIVSMGYTIQKSQTFGERERFISGKMSDETKTLMIDASTTV